MVDEMHRWVAAVVFLVLGCGAGAGPTVAGLAERLRASSVGCESLRLALAQRELGSREEGSCRTATGERLTILVYDDNNVRDRMNEIASVYGGTAAVGDRWTVRTDTAATAEAAAAVLR